MSVDQKLSGKALHVSYCQSVRVGLTESKQNEELQRNTDASLAHELSYTHITVGLTTIHAASKRHQCIGSIPLLLNFQISI